MEERLRNWLALVGFTRACELRAMRRGMGSASLWSFRPESGEPLLVARVFPQGEFARMEREAMAMTTAIQHGLPVPKIVARGAVDRWPILATWFVEGELAEVQLVSHPEQAREIGWVLGEALGRLHRVVAPEGISHAGAWIDRAGKAIDPIREKLVSVSHQDRLIHLDYHPRNIVMRDGRVTGVIDWENAHAGPPHMDVARSRAVLRAAVLGALGVPVDAGVIAKFENGLIAGHESVVGPDPHPELSKAWGLAMTVEDVQRQANKHGDRSDMELVRRLVDERNAAIASAVESQHR